MMATQGADWTGYCARVAISPCAATTTYPVLPNSFMVGQQGDLGVSGYVSQPQADGAIGFTPYAMALAAGFPVALVLNAAGYYTEPTAQNVGVSLLAAQVNTNSSDPLYGTANLSGVYTDTDPRTYELSYLSYLILPTDTSGIVSTSTGYTLGAFGAYALCQGQQPVDQLGYAALPVNLASDAYEQLAKAPGAALPGSVSAFLAGCDSPTISSSGTDALASSTPMPPACDQQGPTQCTSAVSPEGTQTTTTVTASPASPIPGQATTLTATVTSATAGPQVAEAVFTPSDVSAFQPSAGVVIVTVRPTSSFTVPLTTTVPSAGVFTLTVPTTGTVTMTVSGSTASGDILPVVVSDSRNTYPGWSVSGQVSDFTTASPGPDTIISGNQLGWIPDTTSVASGVTLGNAVQAAAPGLGSAAAALASASAGSGFGTSTLGAQLSLVIPPTAVPGPYTSVLTLTAVTSAP